MFEEIAQAAAQASPQIAPASVSFLPALLGALVGGGFAVMGQFIKAALDSYAARCEDLCSIIDKAADTAAEYWLIGVKTPDFLDIKSGIDPDALAGFKLEGKIEKLQEQILILDENLRSALPASSRIKIKDLMPIFMDALTGKAFRARSGEIEVVNASLVQFHAAALIAEIKIGLRQNSSPLFCVLRLFRLH